MSSFLSTCISDRLNHVACLALGRADDDLIFAPLVAATALTAITTLVIGVLGMSGVLSSTTAGWVILGLGAGGGIMRISLGNLSGRRIYLIATTLVALAFVVLGALGGTGILSATQLGWGIIGTSLASPIFKFIFSHPYEEEKK